MFVPIGTPVIAPADGRIYGYGDTIGPMTGRWVGIDFDNGMRWRSMHHSRLTLSRAFMGSRGFVRAGSTVALSGASGYGYEDWSRLSTMPGAHTHVTLWPTHVTRFGYDRNGKPYSIDFMNHVAKSGGAATPITEEETMSMQIAKNQDDSSKVSSRFIWGDGKQPQIINDSTADIFKDAGVKESPMSRDRWLWLLEWAKNRARSNP
nr:M23 family metallopeptidase [Microbacterium sp. CBA3102]